MNPAPHSSLQYTVLALRREGRHVYTLKIHANGVGLVCLGPDHPLLTYTQKDSMRHLTKVVYSQMALDGISGVSGKRKKGASVLFPRTPLMKVVFNTGVEVQLHIPLRSKVIELNERLETEPDLLRTYPESKGFLYIMLLRLDYRKALLAVLPVMTHRGEELQDGSKLSRERLAATEEQHKNVDQALGFVDSEFSDLNIKA
ncbi:hypothetical protein GMRT_13987 [Giardia muris]|uniref:Uncharacterized protein n=1 Tax=Giardia muris TaxID=5742 RepID=A0A4Z1TAQ0_GIAMU|nr:hypothetical protein GMRT_13987 [Giardia muris]|eukprot:TNJ29599.1 hypothetical protein GMRT_13987 [Giardia muris]